MGRRSVASDPGGSRELFYQLVLRGFAAFATLTLQPPAPLVPLLRAALAGRAAADAGEAAAVGLAAFLGTKAAMLDEYFGLALTPAGELRALPALLDQCVPGAPPGGHGPCRG